MPDPTQPWRNAPAAYEVNIDPTTPPVHDHHIDAFPRALAERLAERATASPAGIAHRANDPTAPADQQWQTITVHIAGHTVVAAATADPFVPREWVWQLTVDDRPVSYGMTYGRPLADVLADAAWQAVRAAGGWQR